MTLFSLEQHGINVKTVHRNLAPCRLYEEAILNEPDTRIADSGALVAYSGAKTGRSPKDKRIVKNDQSERDTLFDDVIIFALKPRQGVASVPQTLV